MVAKRARHGLPWSPKKTRSCVDCVEKVRSSKTSLRPSPARRRAFERVPMSSAYPAARPGVPRRGERSQKHGRSPPAIGSSAAAPTAIRSRRRSCTCRPTPTQLGPPRFVPRRAGAKPGRRGAIRNCLAATDARAPFGPSILSRCAQREIFPLTTAVHQAAVKVGYRGKS